MSTNYYLKINQCVACGRYEQELHIGKKSCGWAFALHVAGDSFPLLFPSNLGHWEKLFIGPGKIVDEYGRGVTVERMLEIITQYTDNIPLQREPVDGTRCIGHGPGPYDLITGEFC